MAKPRTARQEEGFFARLTRRFRRGEAERDHFAGPGGPQGGPGDSVPGDRGYSGAVNLGDEGGNVDPDTD